MFMPISLFIPLFNAAFEPLSIQQFEGQAGQLPSKA